jgi:hypothetical protein
LVGDVIVVNPRGILGRDTEGAVAVVEIAKPGDVLPIRGEFAVDFAPGPALA